MIVGRYEQSRSPAPNNKQELDEAPLSTLSCSGQNKVLSKVMKHEGPRAFENKEPAVPRFPAWRLGLEPLGASGPPSTARLRLDFIDVPHQFLSTLEPQGFHDNTVSCPIDAELEFKRMRFDTVATVAAAPRLTTKIAFSMQLTSLSLRRTVSCCSLKRKPWAKFRNEYY